MSIIPLPHRSVKTDNTFSLNQDAAISLPVDSPEWQRVANYLNDRLKTAAASRLSVNFDGEGDINFLQDTGLDNEEAYRIIVDSEGASIFAKTPHGAFYGVQTLLQLMPAEIFSMQKNLDFPIEIQGAEIEDMPRFTYRGLHLDVGRHFFGMADIKQFIDLMAIHKYNKFHWHLTEDQGWRIEIKQYPKLTEIGAFRKETVIGHANNRPEKYDGKPYGGFYTQQDIKEVIAYATERFITIIPEIELPGHAQAAIAAYPELGCLDDTLDVGTTWGVSENVFCPKEETFEFLENVLNEVMDLFPGEYLHIGGDECPKKQWEENAYCQALIKREGLKDEHGLQSYFIRRIEKMLNARGKRLIGWDEILEGGLAPNATVMSWRGVEGGIEAASAGHDVIMTPTSHCYLDYYQSLHPDEPLAIGGYLPLEKVYSFEPIPEALPQDKHHHVLGGQANVWTEYIPTASHLQYMTYPRAAALAEVVWSDKSQRDFYNFSQRLTGHFKRYNAYGINAAESFFEVQGTLVPENGQVRVSLQSPDPNARIHYTLDGSPPSLQSMKYAAPFIVSESSEIKAAAFEAGSSKGRIWSNTVTIHKAVGKDIMLTTQPAEKYGWGGKASIINGIYGSNEHYGDKEWLGFSGKDFEAVIDLGEETVIEKIACRFFNQNGSWIYLPKKMSVFTSNDGKTFEFAGMVDDIQTTTKVAAPHISLNAQGRYVKVAVARFGIIPENLPGASHEAWLFVGELEVH